MNKVPKFCSFCGKELKAGKRQVGFDPFTGKADTIPTMVCPDREEPMSRHDRWEQNPANVKDEWEKWDS